MPNKKATATSAKQKLGASGVQKIGNVRLSLVSKINEKWSNNDLRNFVLGLRLFSNENEHILVRKIRQNLLSHRTIEDVRDLMKLLRTESKLDDEITSDVKLDSPVVETSTAKETQVNPCELTRFLCNRIGRGYPDFSSLLSEAFVLVAELDHGEEFSATRPPTHGPTRRGPREPDYRSIYRYIASLFQGRSRSLETLRPVDVQVISEAFQRLLREVQGSNLSMDFILGRADLLRSARVCCKPNMPETSSTSKPTSIINSLPEDANDEVDEGDGRGDSNLVSVARSVLPALHCPSIPTPALHMSRLLSLNPLAITTPEADSAFLDTNCRCLSTATKCVAVQGHISVPERELNLETVMSGGQVFHWRRDSHGWWCGVQHCRLWRLRHDQGKLYYEAYLNSFVSKDHGITRQEAESFLRDFFQLNVNLGDLYDRWMEADPLFHGPAKRMPGVRIIRQDPLECLFSFITSSNNNVPRITTLVRALVDRFGAPVCWHEGRLWRAFPAADRLAQADVEAELTQLKFGYRAAFIQRTATQLLELGVQWLYDLGELPLESVHASLMKLTGVGRKVAACICLMAFGKHECVPFDTNIVQIARERYGFDDVIANENRITVSEITIASERFVDLWGPYAGWTQAVIYADYIHKRSPEKSSLSKESHETATKTRLPQISLETLKAAPGSKKPTKRAAPPTVSHSSGEPAVKSPTRPSRRSGAKSIPS